MSKHSFIISTLCAVSLLAASCGDKDSGEWEGAGSGGRNIVEAGTLEAVRTKTFILPRFQYGFGSLRVVGLIDHGSMVRTGDSLIQIDLSGIDKYISDRRLSLEKELANAEKLSVTQDNKINALLSSVQSEQASFDLKKIELEATAFESERTKQIKQFEFEQAEINLAQNQRRLELARVINENELKIQRIRLGQIENDIRNVERIKSMYTIRTDVNGVFQVGINYRNGLMLRVGDEVFMGQPMGNVPELEHMKVTTFINENDFLKIREGQKVAVRLDATPNIVFDGEISYIGKLCHLKDPGTNSRQKVFDVEVKVLKYDERLKPGMTVSCEFLDR